MNENQMSLDDFLEDLPTSVPNPKNPLESLNEFLENAGSSEYSDESNEPATDKKPTTEKKSAKKKPSASKDDYDEISGEDLQKMITTMMEQSFDEEIRKIAIEVDEKALKTASKEVVEIAVPKIIKEVKEQLQLTHHIIELPDLPPVETEHPLHECFDDVMTMLLAGFNVYMYGDAGTGKTQIAEDIAKAMNLPFYNLTSGDMVGVYGYTDLSGKFHETPFTKAFKNGGILYISEFDSIDPSIALTVNTAIANGITTINDETCYKHKDFYVLCDGNTRGNGADFDYSGRNKLDASTINRFLFQEVKYDRNIEMFLAKQNEDLVDFVDYFRESVVKLDVPCLATYRAIQAFVVLENKFGIEKTMNIALLKGMQKDDLIAVQKEMRRYNTNKYIQALLNMEA